MDCKSLKIHAQELLTFAELSMRTYRVYPYAAFVIHDNIVIAKGRNEEQETRDITRQSEVVAIRNAQNVVKAGSLSGYTILSLMEPTILSFDVALWAGIRDFAWCVDSTYFSEHYTSMSYSPLQYAKQHPTEISITRGLYSSEAVSLIEEAMKSHYYPDSLLIRTSK